MEYVEPKVVLLKRGHVVLGERDVELVGYLTIGVYDHLVVIKGTGRLSAHHLEEHALALVHARHRPYFDGKRKLTRFVFAFHKKDYLRLQIQAFEDENNSELEGKLEERGWVQKEDGRPEPGSCATSHDEYIERCIIIRSNGFRSLILS